MNIAIKRKNNNKVILMISSALSILFFTYATNAATSTAILNVGSTSAKGSVISITDEASKMTVANGSSEPFQLIGKAKKYNVSIIPDTVVHTSYARPKKEVVSWFYPKPTSYYAVANTEYNNNKIWGSVRITD